MDTVKETSMETVYLLTKTGHFYFAENRTFLLGLDRGKVDKLPIYQFLNNQCEKRGYM